MVIIGLGSNQGDRLYYLRRALGELKNMPEVTVTSVSPVYHSQALLPPQADKSWNTPYLNAAVCCETTLDPFDFLKKINEIEKKLGRVPLEKWGPRTIDIDLLAWDNRIIQAPILTLPHPELLERPFALWPLADISPDWIYPVKNTHQGKTAKELVQSWGSRLEGSAPLQTKQIRQRIDTIQFIGIINMTPDSFSSDGILTNPTLAFSQAQKHVEQGATVLDIGAESTRPGATPLSDEAEWSRLAPILEGILQHREHYLIKPKISVDTYHPITAKRAIALGVDWINDVTGFSNRDMCDVVKNTTTELIVMHSLGIPPTQERTLGKYPVKELHYWAIKRLASLEKQGIQRERCLIDIGIGFGKTAEQSVALLKNMRQFQDLGVRLVVGHSRKSFLNLFTKKPFAERDFETSVITRYLAEKNVDYVRVHVVDG